MNCPDSPPKPMSHEEKLYEALMQLRALFKLAESEGNYIVPGTEDIQNLLSAARFVQQHMGKTK